MQRGREEAAEGEGAKAAAGWNTVGPRTEEAESANSDSESSPELSTSRARKACFKLVRPRTPRCAMSLRSRASGAATYASSRCLRFAWVSWPNGVSVSKEAMPGPLEKIGNLSYCFPVYVAWQAGESGFFLVHRFRARGRTAKQHNRARRAEVGV